VTHLPPASRAAGYAELNSGTGSDANYNKHPARLHEGLQTADLQSTGEPIYSRYKPLFMPWFLRRNDHEI